ncbi:hypothetical protein RG2014_03 [Delftia phage RG-2014]|uniref:Uncharacterized protein n=1 Tax=Delftia phage RG-2014 TaxID=1563661 RepID=A0A097PBC7_9CAUD|nr:hypothetical protein RG2014_03 [Delftia phage RG-2014]AIU44256.1 hypothetical protein RG2014_03 [Delftia phage RG-2014]
MSFVSPERAALIAANALDNAKAAFQTMPADMRKEFMAWCINKDKEMQSRLFPGVQAGFKLVAMSNFYRDYWDEEEHAARWNDQAEAQIHADYLNNQKGIHAEEHWVVKPANYQLKKGSDQL